MYVKGTRNPGKEVREKLNQLFGLPVEFLSIEERLEEAFAEYVGFTSAGTRVTVEELAEDYSLSIDELRKYLEGKNVKL